MKGKVYIDTVGCPKNFNDSEHVAGILEANGYDITLYAADADFIIVNTCGFLEDAKKESIDHIFDMYGQKKKGAKLVVSGCLAQRYSDELFQELGEADAIIGVNDYSKIADILENLDERLKCVSGYENASLNYNFRKLADNPYTATIKIAEGCNNTCTYCIIPKIRGKYRSKPMAEIIEEARHLADSGCKEVVLIAQDVTYYGIDLYGKQKLPELLRELCKIEKIRWIRLMYCYDERITEELIETMASEEKICNYIDIPLQHASDEVLRRMKRHSNYNSIKNTIQKLRSAMPDICIRTTLIVGFPGETQSDFEKLEDMVKSLKFDRLGVFAYSNEEGTAAFSMEDQIDDDIKQERLDSIMRKQMMISAENNSQMVGKTLEVIIDDIDEEGSYIGRTRYDALEIDNGVIFSSDKTLKIGDIVQVDIVDSFDYDLLGIHNDSKQ